MGIEVNKETYNRWRKLVIGYGGKVPHYHHKGSTEFLLDLCKAIPFTLKIVPIKTKRNRK